MVIDTIVELHASLHGVDDILLRAIAADRRVDVFRCLVHRTERRERVKHQRDVSAGQLFSGVQRRCAELGDVGQDRCFHTIGEQLVHVQLGNRLRENHVSAGLDARCRAIKCRFQTFHCQCVGTRHDHEAVIGTGIDGGFDAIDHFLLADDFFIGAMAAALGADLILNVNCRRAKLDHRLDRARHVEGRRAKTGVDIHQQRQVANVGDTAHVGQHIIQPGDAQIRHAQRACGHAAAGQVDRLETGALGQQRVVGVDRADHLQRMLAGDRIAEALARRVQVGSHASPRSVAVLLWAPSS